jgi:hypothetical protein
VLHIRAHFIHGLPLLRDFALVAPEVASGRLVRPAKAGIFSGSQSHQGKSQSPVTWVAFVEETKRMKPTDKAIFRMVSESPGRNISEPSGGLDKE